MENKYADLVECLHILPGFDEPMKAFCKAIESALQFEIPINEHTVNELTDFVRALKANPGPHEFL